MRPNPDDIDNVAVWIGQVDWTDLYVIDTIEL